MLGTFPRVGIPRRFESYAEYAEAIDVLLRCGAFPEPTFLWWDARLQPRFGTIEVRAMDAQTRLADTAGLTALVQCLVHRAVLEDGPPESAADAQEVLEENRFIAARDGMRAELIDRRAAGASPSASGWTRCWKRARRTRWSSAARPSWRARGRSRPPRRGAPARAGGGGARRVGRRGARPRRRRAERRVHDAAAGAGGYLELVVASYG